MIDTKRNRLLIRLLIVLSVFAFVIPLAAKDTYNIYVFFNNDRHGGISKSDATFMNPETPPPLGNYSSEAALVKEIREKAAKDGDNVVILDQGDIWQGAPVGSLTDGEAIVRAYNVLMPDAVTIGNHEFDSGHENVNKLIELAEFPFLAGNLFKGEEGTIYPGIKPFIIKDFKLPNGENFKVGIIGITTKDTKGMSMPGNTDVLVVGDEIKYAQMYADSLKKLGCDFIMLSAHLGLPFDAEQSYFEKFIAENERSESANVDYSSVEYVELASAVTGIDAAFGGHIHVGYHKPWEDPNTHMLVFQNYAKGTGVGLVKFKFDIESKVFLGYESLGANSVLNTLFLDDFWPDKDMEKIVDSLSAAADANLMTVIAQSNGMLNRGDAQSNKVGHIVCDAMIMAADADISIVNMGGVRAELPGGNITKKDVFNVMPFDNKIVNIKMSGKDCMLVIERMAGKYGGALVGGIKIEYNGDKPEGERVRKITFVDTGEDIDPEKEYVFSSNDYVFHSYGISQFDNAPEGKVKHTGILLRTAIEQWLSANSPVDPKTDGRWVDVTY